MGKWRLSKEWMDTFQTTSGIRGLCRHGASTFALVSVLSFSFAASTWTAELPPLPQTLTDKDPVQAGQLLAQRLRMTAPSEGTSLKGTLKIRRERSATLRIPFRFEAKPGQTNWQAIYETAGIDKIPAQKVTIIHWANRPSQYLFAQASKPGQAPGEPVILTNDQATISLANSDFWLADLGLEFAHWPAQRFIKGQVRSNRYCYVLESTNPDKSGNGYGRVLSWIDKESGGIIVAQGFDKKDKLLKEFRVSSVKKVQGQWELQEMEIDNVRTNSRTKLEFDYSK